MGTGIPSLYNLLVQWWGPGTQCYAFAAQANLAANLIFGTNPPYQVADFLAMYPKFGTYAQSIAGIAVNQGGAGYVVGDVLLVVQSDAQDGTVTVGSVDGSGAVTALTVNPAGTGYSVANGLATTGGTGAGCTVNITQISPFTSVGIPLAVLQLYVNLASASLIQARWLDYWQVAMGLFVAHFATLYLRSEGNPGSTPGQIAASGLEKGLIASQAAGDVSMSREFVSGLEEFAGWTETTYGTQLATWAKVVGIGPAYFY